MGSCHHPNMVTPQRVMGEMTVSKSSGNRVGNVTRKRTGYCKMKLQVEKKLTPIKDKIQSFDLISFRGQQGNYVGEWVIRTEDARYIFKTSCILAGGYNIQCLHARYMAILNR